MRQDPPLPEGESERKLPQKHGEGDGYMDGGGLVCRSSGSRELGLALSIVRTLQASTHTRGTDKACHPIQAGQGLQATTSPHATTGKSMTRARSLTTLDYRQGPRTHAALHTAKHRSADT